MPWLPLQLPLVSYMTRTGLKQEDALYRTTKQSEPTWRDWYWGWLELTSDLDNPWGSFVFLKCILPRHFHWYWTLGLGSKVSCSLAFRELDFIPYSLMDARQFPSSCGQVGLSKSPIIQTSDFQQPFSSYRTSRSCLASNACVELADINHFNHVGNTTFHSA